MFFILMIRAPRSMRGFLKTIIGQGIRDTSFWGSPTYNCRIGAPIRQDQGAEENRLRNRRSRSQVKLATIPKEREARYNKKYNVDDQGIKGFVDDYYELIAKADLRLFAAVVDKVHVAELHQSVVAPAIAYEVLLQRVVQEVKLPTRVSVVIDDMTGGTPKGRQYRANLEVHHARLKKMDHPC